MSYAFHGIRQLGDDFPDNIYERKTGFQPVSADGLPACHLHSGKLASRFIL
jgi:hypothetical protein